MSDSRFLGSEGGFTLIELMVAMTVLLIALMGFMAAEQVSIKLDLDTENQQAALDAAAAKLEEVRSVSFTDLLSWNGTTFDVDGLVPPRHSAQQHVGRISVLQQPNSKLISVEVLVEWQSQPHPRELRLGTMVSSFQE